MPGRAPWMDASFRNAPSGLTSGASAAPDETVNPRHRGETAGAILCRSSSFCLLHLVNSGHILQFRAATDFAGLPSLTPPDDSGGRAGRS